MVLNRTTHHIYDTIRISKISNEQCNICRSWSKPVSKAMARVYPCKFYRRIVYEIKFDAPIKGHHVYKETWTTQKYDILYCKKEVLDIDKHVLGILQRGQVSRTWIYDRRSNKLRVSGKLMAKVKYFYGSECNESEKPLFVTSNGKVNNFMCRNGFSLHQNNNSPARS